MIPILSPLQRAIPAALLLGVLPLAAAPEKPVILDEMGAKNLRIETVVAQETDFEETVFALGRIESIPNNAATVSSRIPGRIVDLQVAPGDTVTKDQIVAKVESRQPGDPPPVIELKAPLGGLVTSSEVRLGEPVEPDKSLIGIIDLSEVYAVGSVPEHQSGKMKPGTKAHIQIPALPDKTFEGELLRFGISADRDSGTIDAVFRLSNKGGELRPGMLAEFSIVTAKRENVMSIPRAALQGEPSNRYVYVKHVELPNTFEKASVQVGMMNDRFVEILGGIFPADEVVTRGAYSLSFAGGGSGISLKEVLDAAHGHEHAEDGSELTPEKRAELAAKRKGVDPSAKSEGGASPIWKYVSGVLFLLLIASFFSKLRKQPEDETVSATSKPESH